MEVSNASLYDAGTALAEACQMACDASKKRKVLLADTVHPEYRRILKTYTISGKIELTTSAGREGRLDARQMAAMIDRETACVVIQQPNFFGNMEEIKDLEEAIHREKDVNYAAALFLWVI